MGNIVDDDFYKIFKKYNLDFTVELELREEIINYIDKNFIKKEN